MPQRVFYLDQEKRQCIQAAWEPDWVNLKLRFQEQEIGTFTTRQELAEGRQFVMQDGHLLSVRLKGGLQPELELLRDGLLLQSNDSPAHYKSNTIAQLALLLGILNITAGTAAAITKSDILLSIGFGYGSIAVGVVYLLVALGSRRLSGFATFAIAGVFAMDLILLFVFTAMKEGPSSPVSGMVIKLFLLYAYVKGTGAIQNLQSQAAEETVS